MASGSELRSLAKRALRPVFHRAMQVSALRRRARTLAHAGRIPRVVWNQLPVVEDEFTVDLPGGASFRYRPVPGDGVGQILYWSGVSQWEAATLQLVIDLAPAARRFLDLGANTGVYSLLACAVNPELRAIAYEPVPRIAALLAANIACNGFGDRLVARAVALSSECGVARLNVPYAEVPASASLLANGFRNIPGEPIEVEARTVDAEILAAPGVGPGSERPVDLVKIDVEGLEDRVVEGMAGVLARDRPIIVCECNPDGPYRRVAALLAPRDYAFFHIRDPRPVREPTIRPDPTERHRNHAFVPVEKIPAGWR